MSRTLTIATWNINSVRLRIDQVVRFLQERQPDVLCLQEIKCQDDQFPFKPLRKLGYEHVAVRGQKAYHGVAIVSRIPFLNTTHRLFYDKDDARHLEVVLDVKDGLTLHNFYVPAGGDEPDPEINEKFAHKLGFMNEMAQWYEGMALEKKKPARMVLVGDLNIAPQVHDVWSHKDLIRVVSHTPVEVDLLGRVQSSLHWVDAMRRFVPESEKLYSWWSYRAKDWEASNRGRRLDHIWVTPDLEENLRSMSVVKEARGWERASDHAPVLVTLGI